MPKVLVVATSRKTKGGITSVVKAHETGEQWKKFHCKWIETHRDGNSVRKLWYLATALIEYICLLPFYDIVHIDRKSTRLNSSHSQQSRMPSYCSLSSINGKASIRSYV